MKIGITVKDYQVHGVGDRFPDEQQMNDLANAIATDIEDTLRMIGTLIDRGKVIVTLDDGVDQKVSGRG